MNTCSVGTVDLSQCFLHIPFNQRWDYFKLVIQRYYVEEGHTISDLADFMRLNYRFDASDRQYKYHLKKWKANKSVPGKVKEEVCTALGKRSRDTTSTPLVVFNGGRIDKAKLRRYMITAIRQDNALRLSQNVFLHWNLPYKALKTSRMIVNQIDSPFGGPSQTPNHISIASPGMLRNDAVLGDAGSPQNMRSPHDAPTPTMSAIRKKQMDDRAKLLIQGRHDDLLDSMNRSERKIATTWLYQFWLYSYKTAKYWGRGPQDWSVSVLHFTDFKDQQTTNNTPQAWGATPVHHDDNFDMDVNTDSGGLRTELEPSRLCFWSIHGIDDLDYGRASHSSPPERINDAEFETMDEAEWPDWPEDHQNLGFVEKLQNSLRTNSFSNIDMDDLPMSITQIAKSAELSPEQMLIEAFGFAITSRNEKLLWELIDDIDLVDLSCLLPVHIAATYISGAKTCCNVLDFVIENFTGPNVSQKLYINSLGHTVLDILMMGILKSHTSCLPVVVDGRFANDKRFAGEDLDVCGRWDADSPCIRKLLAQGNLQIPSDWKHMFCHTSAQALCHCIGTLFGATFAPDINTPSGLFTKQCSCGRRLQLQPLHCLVMIAFHLCQHGRPGENLFGTLACLVCLLVNGINPLGTACISIDMLVGVGVDACSHSDLDPLQLAERLLAYLAPMCSDELQLGWSIFCKVLALAQKERGKDKGNTRDAQHDYRLSDSHDPYADYALEENYACNMFEEDFADKCGEEEEGDDESEDGGVWCQHHKTHGNFYSGSKEIATLWGAIQTELLTYRKIGESDAWISTNFDMKSLLGGLDNGFGVSLLPLVERDMMRPLCRCGRFQSAHDEACVMVQEASAWYFSNTDIWDRATYIVVPEFREEYWYRG